MEKQREQDRADLEMKRLCGVFGSPQPPEEEKPLDKVKEPSRPYRSRERMAEAGVRNLGAYVRKMALNGYVLHVDLSPVRELVSLQRRCSNNLNQVAIQANTYGGIYPEEIKALQRDYETLWEPLSDLLKKLSAVVEL